MDIIALLTSPIRILYGDLDKPMYKASTEVIFQSVATKQKAMKGYPNSKHLMTLDTDINYVNKDNFIFLNDLTW